MNPGDAAYHSFLDTVQPKSLEYRHHNKKQRRQRQARRRLWQRTVDESVFYPESQLRGRLSLCGPFDSAPDIGRGNFDFAWAPIGASEPEASPAHRLPIRYRPWYAGQSVLVECRFG